MDILVTVMDCNVKYERRQMFRIFVAMKRNTISCPEGFDKIEFIVCFNLCFYISRNIQHISIAVWSGTYILGVEKSEFY